MADTKFSELDAATFVDNDDIVAIVQSPDSKKATRELLLTANGAEKIALKGFMSAQVFIETNGGIFVQPKNGQGFAVYRTDTFDAMMVAGGDGSITLNAYSSGTIHLNCGGAIVWLEDDGDIVIQQSSGKVLTLGYDPLTPSDWSGSPASVWEALDRISAKIVAITGVPIP